MESVKITHGRKKTRGELRLPQLHFIAIDDWQEKIGKEALFAWLEFYTLADRSDSRLNPDCDVVPRTMGELQRRLKVGKDTFYNKIIRPLWNYGFIDLQEIQLNGKTGHNPVNIIVYEYPQNNPDMATKPLKKIRDYDTDYNTNTRVNAKKGGRPKTKIKGSSETELGKGSSETELPLVPTKNYPSSETEPNNVLNLINVSELTNEMNNNQSVNNTQIESESIKSIIQKNIQMLDRRTDIEKVYLVVKDHKNYNDITFISTLEKAIKAKIRVPFYQYFLKAIENNLKDQTVSRESSSVKQETTPKKDMLPDWVAKQTEHKHDSFPNSNQKLDEEQKRQAQELLRALDELGNS